MLLKLGKKFRGYARLGEQRPKASCRQIIEHRPNKRLGYHVTFLTWPLSRGSPCLANTWGSAALRTIHSGLIIRIGIRCGFCGEGGRCWLWNRNLSNDLELRRTQKLGQPLPFDLAHRNDLRHFTELLTNDRCRLLRRLDDEFVLLAWSDGDVFLSHGSAY